MRWAVTIPGQPISTNHAYRTGRMFVARRGVPVIGEDGRQRIIHRPVKTAEAQQYHDDVMRLVMVARPSRWRPEGQIRVVIDLHLVNDMDADGCLKILLDGLADGMGVNDRTFLPTVRSKEAGLPPRDARVDLMIDDDTTRPY
jgi:hypothetical protein